MAERSILSAEPLDVPELLREFTAQADGAGAIVSFTGVARPTSKTGELISGLFLDHHETLTVGSMEAIAEEAMRRFDIVHLLAVHRSGFVSAGGPIVLVAAASAHRRAALQAVDYTMDRLKTDAVFWKREDGGNRSEWIDPTAADHADRARWDEL